MFEKHWVLWVIRHSVVCVIVQFPHSCILERLSKVLVSTSSRSLAWSTKNASLPIPHSQQTSISEKLMQSIVLSNLLSFVKLDMVAASLVWILPVLLLANIAFDDERPCL